MLSFYEFFAGGGMARAGLGKRWNCAFANDFSPLKEAVYRANWAGGPEFVGGDICAVDSARLPGKADLAWASFPCQDLSLAGVYRGLGAAKDKERTRSGVFWPFWSLMERLGKRRPKMIVLENVAGLLTSNGGKDFEAVCTAISSSGYRLGCLVMDAEQFLPQSRARVFVVAIEKNFVLHPQLIGQGPNSLWHPDSLMAAHSQLPKTVRENWVWWQMPKPSKRTLRFIDLIEENPLGTKWHSQDETSRMIGMMSNLNLKKLEAAKKSGVRMVGGIYRRTRFDENGNKVQRAEVRFDDIAGCLRTPRGGSSRQFIILVEGNKVRSRLLSPREAARLMGLPDTYRLPENYNDAYQISGDGVAVPVVRHLAKHILEPQLTHATQAEQVKAA